MEDAARAEAVNKAVDEQLSVKTMLTVSILEGTGLRPGLTRHSSTYAACQLADRPRSKVQTEEVAGNSDPTWNYEGVVDGCAIGDSLEFVVLADAKNVTGECLGRATLQYSEFHPNGFEGPLPLSGGKIVKGCALKVKVEEMPVPVAADEERREDQQRVFVTFQSAQGLRMPGELAEGEQAGGPAPYCVCEISGKPDSRVRSRICRDSTSQVWGEIHELEDFEDGEDLHFTLFHHAGAGGEDEELGTAVLSCDDFFETGFDGELQLEGAQATGSIKVCVDVGGFSTDPRRTQTAAFEPTSEATGGESSTDATKSKTGGGFYKGFMSKARNAKSKFMSKGKLVAAMTKGSANRDDGPQKHPSEVLGPSDRHPVPFQLRCLDTGRVHRLVAYTVVGRSRHVLDPRFDLILETPGNCDVSRKHAVIKAWLGLDKQTWEASVYDEKTGRGLSIDVEGERLHVGGATTVDGEPLDPVAGTAIVSGSVLRFGINELWVVEAAALHQRSRVAEIASRRAQQNAEEDPALIRELRVPSFTCDSALQRCEDWISIVRVVLEAHHEPDEPPCADCIEVQDECGRPVSRHLAQSLEQQQEYDVKKILRDVRLGATLRLRLSSDPLLLAPVLCYLDKVKASVDELYKSRASVLG